MYLAGGVVGLARDGALAAAEPHTDQEANASRKTVGLGAGLAGSASGKYSHPCTIASHMHAYTCSFVPVPLISGLTALAFLSAQNARLSVSVLSLSVY